MYDENDRCNGGMFTSHNRSIYASGHNIQVTHTKLNLQKVIFNEIYTIIRLECI